MSKEELPKPVAEMLVSLENDPMRINSKAKLKFLKTTSELLECHSDKSLNADGLKQTPKIKLEKDSITYEVWLEERVKQIQNENKKQTILFVRPTDEFKQYEQQCEPYEMVTIQDQSTLLDLNEDEIEDAEDIVKLTAVLDFMSSQLSMTKLLT